MKKLKYSFISLLLVTIFSSSAFALSVPALTSPVVDNADIISYQTESQLNSYLVQLSNQTGIQVAVLTVPSLQGESLEAYSIKVCETWKLGSKEKDNGVLLLVALQEHAVRIEVGYGLESVLTDMKCGLIIRNVIAPYFRTENYDAGIKAAIQNIVGIVTNDETLVEKSVTQPQNNAVTVIPGIFSFIFFIIMMNILISTKWGRKILFFLHLTSHLNPPNNRGRTNYSNSFRGSNFRGGGFGGFSGGGGGFGGGGASGHW